MTHLANISDNQKLVYKYFPSNQYNINDSFYGAVSPVLHLLTNKKDLVIAEIGVWKGDSSLAILENCDVKKMYLIDPWSSDIANEYNNKDGINDRIPSIDFVQNRLEKHKDKLVYIQKPSDLAYNDIPDNELDFIWIDGAHDYTSVYKDLVHYYPKVKMNGLIAGDDFSNKQRNSANFGVIEAVNDVLGDLGYTELDLYKHSYKPDDYYTAFVCKKTIEAEHE